MQKSLSESALSFTNTSWSSGASSAGSDVPTEWIYTNANWMDKSTTYMMSGPMLRYRLQRVGKKPASPTKSWLDRFMEGDQACLEDAERPPHHLYSALSPVGTSPPMKAFKTRGAASSGAGNTPGSAKYSRKWVVWN
jgi:hypothetical protein